MKVAIECMYCGEKWEKTIYNQANLEHERCPICKSTKYLKVKDLKDTKVDYYKDCKPFPKKDDDDNGFPYGMGGYITPGSE